MGYAATWCAVSEEVADSFLQVLGLSATGATEEHPTSLITAAHLDTGWRVLWYNKHACPFLRPRDLQRLSSAASILVCRIEEHVMASSAEMWSGGLRTWWLSHQAEEDPGQLATEGELPQSFASIREKMERAQLADQGDEVDYIFEIPLMVAQSVVGFKHDDGCPHLIGKFQVLRRAAPRGFLGRLFGSTPTRR